jgi:hypothetical protein
VSAGKRAAQTVAAVIPISQSPRFASPDPDTFSPDFDLIHELTMHRDRYIGPEWVAVHVLPAYLRTCLERVATAVGLADPAPKPGMNPLVSACVAQGLYVIRGHSDVAATFAIRDRLHTATTIAPEDAEELATFLRTFRLSASDTTGAGSGRLNIAMPGYIKAALNETSNDLGISASQMIVLCAQVVLRDQPAVLADRQRMLQAAVGRFFDRVALRRQVVERWFEWISRKR